MTTYLEMKAQAEELLKEAEKLRRQEVAAVIADIRKKMAEYNITQEDLFAQNTRRREREPRQVRYIGPNGETWSGGPGRKPAWVAELLANGEDIEKYRVS